MTARLYLFIALLVIVVPTLIGVWVGFYLRARRVASYGWEAILARIVPVDRMNIEAVALDLIGKGEALDQRDGPCELEFAQILELTGGVEGLRQLQANCDVLIDLACYCQIWFPEALVVAEELRLNAREVQWHLDRLDAAGRVGSSSPAFAEYAQRIAAIYYLMTRRLLALYAAAEVQGFGDLSAAIA